MENKRIARVGPHKVDIGEVVRDPRGIEDAVTEILEHDFVESRYAQFGAWLSILPDAADIGDWDRALLERYPPLYTLPREICRDCDLGPCDLDRTAGKCGLTSAAFLGRLSLRKACRGCLGQMVASRRLLDHALKVWGESQPVSMGEVLTMSDACPPVGTLTGIYVKNLKDLNRVLSYGEAQLARLTSAGYSGTGTVADFEGMVMHAGSVLLMAMGVAEMIKVACFGFASAANQKIDELENFPPATSAGGWASIEPGKPVIALVGDDFLPAWYAIESLKQGDALNKVELCGVGPAGDDVARFHAGCRIVAPMVKAGKAIRNGVFDVILASDGCVPLDLASEAARVGSRLIWVGSQGVAGLPDVTDRPADAIVDGLVNGGRAVWIRDVEKAGEVAARTAQKVDITQRHSFREDSAVQQALKCGRDCDLCTMACPNNLPLSEAVRQLAGGKWDGFSVVEKGCYFCGKCESACPAGVGLRDIIVAAERRQADKDRFLMRPGRGPLPLTEILQSAFSMVWGNAPGIVVIAGCGDAPRDEVGWLAYELTRRNCIVFVAGCAGGEIARNYHERKGKYIFEQYLASVEPRSLVNCGGCAAISLANNMYMYSRAAGGIPLYGGIPEVGEGSFYTTFSLIVWGSLPDRMYAAAAAYARLGIRVVVGPASGWTWGRYLPGNRYDRSKWWVYHGEDGRKRETEPIPEHLIVPVETKEEALTMAARTFFSTSEMREGRAARLDLLIELCRIFYGQLPEDWHLLVRSHLDIPTRHRIKLIKALRDEQGWEGEALKITRARNRDGRLLTLSEFNTSYGMELGRYHCRLARLLPKTVKERQGSG
jgi:acetyl-CoA decarbonylase/synthase complex subunit alpha